jgi:hypothetical protein
MVKIQTREQLLQYVIAALARYSRRSVARAMYDGTGIVRVLGGFRPMPPSAAPGWIVSVTSAHGKTWRIAVVIKNNGYGLRMLDKIPWENWTDGNTELYSGDDPKRYRRLRDEARKMA